MLRMNQAQLEQARAWIKDCLGTWRDLESEDDVDECSDREIERGVERHYSGGIAQFCFDHDQSFAVSTPCLD